MPHIPEEILDIIIGHAAANGRRYFSCDLVSHTFHQIVLPYKFKSLTFRVSNEIRENLCDIDVIPIPKFCEAINAGDAHALSLVPLVQELSLLRWTGKDGYGNSLIQVPFEKIINSALSFRNLTKLRMEQCVTSPTIMEQLGKLVQLQSLHTWRCHDRPHSYDVSYGALSNLQSLHTLECEGDSIHATRHLACVPMKNLRILKSRDWEVTKAFLTTGPLVQLKELWLDQYLGREDSSYPLLCNCLARMTSLTHLSLPLFQLPDGTSSESLIFTFPELQYLHIHVSLAPRFADQPMKKMEINTDYDICGEVMPVEIREVVRQHWQGIVFPHVEYLEMDRSYKEMDLISIEFWREFLLNVKEVR